MNWVSFVARWFSPGIGHLKKGEESPGSKVSTLTPIQICCWLCCAEFRKMAGKCRELNLGAVSFRIPKVYEDGSQRQGAPVRDVIHLSSVRRGGRPATVRTNV